jgi:hypothetical protein
MKISPGQMMAVIGLPGVKRFEHFVKVIADWQEAWGLYQDGWALAAAGDGTTVFPLWPAKEYAEVCAVNEWKGYDPRAISLGDLTEVLLPKLKLDGVLPGVFFTPSSKGVTTSVDELMLALETELQKY